MAESIRVRIYNVRFGDAILISIPDRDPDTGVISQRHVLIDVGNVLLGNVKAGEEPNPLGTGGDDAVFKPVLQDVLAVLNGAPLDLYVMTHEHLDHVQGLFHAAASGGGLDKLRDLLQVRDVWMTASADADYGVAYPNAKRKMDALRSTFMGINEHLLRSLPAQEQSRFQILLANNNPRSTQQCVDYLKTLAAPDRVHYLYRGVDVSGMHPFKEARFRIWAPEADTSTYYGAPMPMAAGAAPGAVGGGPTAVPPAGVDAGAFYALVQSRASGFVENLLAIDKAQNNTSLVFTIEWRDKRLLFAGDAEMRSWHMMDRQGVLEPVDFLKVSHHGSHNGTPDGRIFDAILPVRPDGAMHRCAAISTWDKTYGGIPHQPTNTRLRERCRLFTTLDLEQRLYYDVTVVG